MRGLRIGANMPNQRGSRKRIVSAWIDQEVKDALWVIAHQRRISLTDLVVECVSERLKHEGVTVGADGRVHAKAAGQVGKGPGL